MSWPLIRYVLTAALRDRLIMALVIILVIGISLSIFLGSGAIVEKDRFAVVFAAAGLRLSGVLGLVLFAVFFIRRSFDARDVEFILSRPVSRPQFLLSYSAGLSLLALMLSAAQGLGLYLMGPHLFGEGHIVWLATVTAENIIMVNTALFFSMVLTSAPSAAMATAGFYVLGRLMGQLLGIIDHFEARNVVMHAMEYVMQGISMAMPRLDLIAQTSWLIYGPSAEVTYILIHSAVFVIFVVTCSLIDLVFRKF